MLHATFLHEGWEFAQAGTPAKVGFSTTEFLPAKVPGHVHLDLVDNGIIGDPFYRMNELGCQWVDQTDWVYRTKFQFFKDSYFQKRVLRFEGLDTVCEISLNGESIATSDNMFRSIEIDVTEKLLEGENELSISFQSSVNTGIERQKVYFEEQKQTVPVARFHEQAFVRKSQYMSGWDWGPRLVSAGIWKPVVLLEYVGRINDVCIRQKHEEDGVKLVFETRHEGPGTILHEIFDPYDALVGTVEGDGELLLSDPILWEPVGIGYGPSLYRIVSSLNEDDEQYDGLEQNIGLRTAALLREPDEFGESFEFVVNEKRVWARGANWIPDHSFPSTVNRGQLRDRLESAVEMGCNMLRVWGGGLYESEDFYDLCDEMGILVWQDFPFACSYYPDTGDYLAALEPEFEENIKRLRNRASLVLWCGNNENHQMYFDKWANPGENQPTRYFGLPIYEELIPAKLAELDPGRSYIPTSPIYGNDGKAGENPNLGAKGDQHYWNVWHGIGDWKHYDKQDGRFGSEYGFCSAPTMDAWNNCLSDEDWSPNSPAVRWHNKTGKAWEIFTGFVKLHYPDFDTLEDWTYYSQLNQRDALRFGVEQNRRSAFCRGSLIWQLNDCWPVQSWAILDHRGNRKALGFELPRLHADVLCSITRDGEEVKVWGVNDSEIDLEDEVVSLAAYDTETGECMNVWSADVGLASDERAVILEASVKGLEMNRTILVAEFEDDSTWQFLGEPKNMLLPPAETIVISTYAEGGLLVQTTTPVFDLMLTENGSTIPFLENVITMPEPGICFVPTKRMPTELEARSLSGYHQIRLTRSPL